MIIRIHRCCSITPAAPEPGVAPGSSASSWLRSGFTLLELILGLSLLALFTVMVAGVVRGSLRSVFWAYEMQLETDQLNRFILLCRQTFQNLPSTAILTLKITETGMPVQQELTISGVPEAFA